MNRSDTFEVRRLALLQALDAKCNGRQVALAQKLGIRPDYVSRMLSTKAARKNISSDFAREIEAKLGLPPLWLDQPGNAQPGASVPPGMGAMMEIALLDRAGHHPGGSGLGVAAFVQDVEDSGLSAANLRAVELEDRGMAAIQRARRVRAVTDVSQTEPVDGDVFVLEHGRRLKPRTLLLINGQWIARSDCADAARYPDIAVDGKDAVVVGRVAWMVIDM